MLEDIKITPLLDTLKLEKIDDSTYFSEKYSNYISNSRLGLINPNKGGTPEAFFKGFKPIYSSSLIIGSAVHGMVLQPEYFNIVDSVDMPSGKIGFVVDELFNLCKGKDPTDDQITQAATKIDYYKGCVTANRIAEIRQKYADFSNAKIRHLQTRGEDSRVDLYLDQKSRDISYNCIRSLQENKYVQGILHPKGIIENPISEYEQAILLDVRIDMPNNGGSFILKLKSKLDNYVINKEMNEIQVNDIKTLGKILSEFPSNVEKYSYSRELAMYSFLLSLVAKKYYNMDNPTIKGHYLVVSTIPNYYSKVVKVTKKEFKEGFEEFKYLLRLVAKYVATDYKDFGIW